MSDNWFLNKHDDGTIFGPASGDQIQDWALAAKISPLDKVSNDGQATWRRAPMFPELHMDPSAFATFDPCECVFRASDCYRYNRHIHFDRQ